MHQRSGRDAQGQTHSHPCYARDQCELGGVAQKVTVALEDDLDGGPADETLRFPIGGTEYEIDLSTKNATAFRRQLAPLSAHARKARREHPRPTRTAAGRRRAGGIRAWAKDQGIAISDRGRIPASVVSQYEAAATNS